MQETAKMKNGESWDLVAQLAARPEFGMTAEEIRAELEPSRYIGRCPEQVEEFPDVIYGAHSLDEYDRMCESALAEDPAWVSPRRRDYGSAAAWSRRAYEIQRILSGIGLY